MVEILQSMIGERCSTTAPRASLVLVVDDSRSVREFLKDGLSSLGYHVSTAENGLQALQMMRALRFDLVVSDICMPEMDGIALYEHLRAEADFADVPFIVMSMSKDREVMQRMHNNGAAGFLTKPFATEQLAMLADKILRDRDRLRRSEHNRREIERKMLHCSIDSLVKALDARDGYTHSHSVRVGRIAVAVGRGMGLASDELERLSLTGRLHDIGKIGIPDSILLKPGRLSDEEFGVIKEHPSTGASIVDSIPRLKDVTEVIVAHHERWDGLGYPHGLAGENIPLRARIIAVADTYHALTSDRPYRKGFTHARAVQIIEENRGAQLCPACTDAFLRIASATGGVQQRTA